MPKEGAKKIDNVEGKIQGVWAGEYYEASPTQVWIFDNGQEPNGLSESTHIHGSWGYKPGTDPSNCDVEDMWFFPPKSKPPSYFTPRGTWMFPLVKREISQIAPDAVGFLNIGGAAKMEKLDVQGTWKLLYKRPGEDEEEEMEIFVKTPDGRKIPLTVVPSNTIKNIKTMVHVKEGIPNEEQRLKKGVKRLDDPKTLADYDIKHGDILDLEGMQIYVKDPSGKIYTLDVDPSNTIGNIKSKLEKQEGIPKEQQRLKFGPKQLEDGPTLRDYGIKHKSTLNLQPMTINVITPEGKNIILDVDPNDTIKDVKKKLENKSNIPVEDQRLLFDDKLLDDRPTLKDYKIKHGDTIQMEPMKINVITPQGKKITLDVKPDDTIKDVKKKVEKEEDIPVEDQRLLFLGKQLDDHPTLKDYKIKHGDTINMEPMKINVITPKGKKISLDVEPSETIKDVKKKIEDKENIPVDDQRLLFDDKLLEDHPTLKDYKINHGDTIDMQPMTINVITPKGKKISLDVEPDDTIKDVKKKIKNKENIPVKDQRLIFDDKLLDDHPTLRDYKVKHGDTIKMEPMTINVVTPNGKNISLDVEPTDKIQDIKKKILDKEGIPVDEQRLIFDGKELDDHPTLKDYKIKHGDTIKMEPMQINVVTPKGKNLTLDVEPSDTIKDIKKKILDQEGIPVEDQRLLFDDKLLDDHPTLKDYKIKHGDTINMEPMTINIIDPKGKKFTINVEPDYIIKEVKQRILEKEGIPLEDQRLLFGDKPLEDRPTLKDYNIKHGDTINMEGMYILIKDWTNKKFPLQVEKDDTIDSVKSQIEKKEGIPKDNQYLIFGGNLLKDEKNLLDYDIKHKSVVNLERMIIYVKDWKGKTYTLTVEPTNTIQEIKKKIEERENIPAADQLLSFNQTPLENPQTLRDYNIVYKDTLDLKQQPKMPEPPVTPKPEGPKYSIQLSPWQDPFSGNYSPKPKIEREGTRLKGKQALKGRYHTTLEGDIMELTKREEEKRRAMKKSEED